MKVVDRISPTLEINLVSGSTALLTLLFASTPSSLIIRHLGVEVYPWQLPLVLRIIKKRVRSGYETSLKPGIHDGEWSSQDSAPTHTGKHHSLLSADPHHPPPPTSLIYPERFNLSNVQATPSGSHIHADISAGIHVDNIALARVAASQIPQTAQPPFIAVENLQATASGADIGIIGTDIQRLPNLPCISPTIVADMWINTSPSPPPRFLQYRSGWYMDQHGERWWIRCSCWPLLGDLVRGHP